MSAPLASRRRIVRPAFVMLLLLPALFGCGLFGREHAEPRVKPTIYSPNGEPLNGGSIGQPSCEDAMAAWFARVDANHDGAVDLDEFLADARRQFAAMDLNRDGVVTPSVLAQYRAPYSSEPPARAASDRDSDQSRGRSRNGEAIASVRRDRADPVMLADVALRNRVTRDEFLSYARRNFASLDANRDGRLSKDELLLTCVQPP